jgi:hypothetical protein
LEKSPDTHIGNLFDTFLKLLYFISYSFIHPCFANFFLHVEVNAWALKGYYPGLFFHKVFTRPRPKTLNWKAKKIATRPKTGNFKTNPSMKRLKKKQPDPKPVISIPTRPRKG